jgi:protein-tyrosine phosphatase
VVHCNAGYSRSPAVAAGLCKVMIGNDRHLFRGKDPNLHVYRMMVKVGKARFAE